MPGDDPEIIFEYDKDEVVFSRLVTDYDVTIDDKEQPVQIPAYIVVIIS